MHNQEDWDTSLGIAYDFWESQLLLQRTIQWGNPIVVHQEVDAENERIL